jgi:hypothetical protein
VQLVPGKLTVQWIPVRRSGVTPLVVAAVAATFIILSHVKVQVGPPTILHPLQLNVMLPLVLSSGEAGVVGPEKNSGSAPEVLDHVAVMVQVVIPAVLAPTVSCMPVVEVNVFAPDGVTVTVEATACPTLSTRNSAQKRPTSQEVRSISRW